MTANEAFVAYKKIADEIDIAEVPPERYIHYRLKDERKLKIYQELVDSGIDIRKFFLANCLLNKHFFIDHYKYDPNKCMMLYHSWDEWLVKKRPEYFRKIIAEIKKGIQIDLDNRDAFLELVPAISPLFLAILYPDILELLLSMDDDWFTFHMPGTSRMDFLRKVVKANLALREMKSYDLLRQKALRCINNK